MTSIRAAWLLVLRDPYRLFFPLGVLFGLAGTGHWLVYGLRWSASYSGYFHLTLQIWLYMGSFISGFLMTAIPRFASAPYARTGEVVSVLACLLAVFVSLTAGAWVAAGAFHLVWLALLFYFIARRFAKKSPGVSPPVEFVWIPFAFLHAAAGTVMILLSQTDVLAPIWMIRGRSMATQGLVLSLVMGIGGFLGPRLMGLHALPTPETVRNAGPVRKRRLYSHAAFAAALFATFWFEGPNKEPGAYFLRAFVVTADLALVSRVFEKPRAKGLFPKLLSASFVLVPAGLWLTALFPAHAVAMLHVLFVGGFSLMTFLVATMVVLSHSGHGDRVSLNLPIFRILPAGIFLSLSARLTAQLLPESYFVHLGAASSLWMATGLAWLWFAAPYLIRDKKEIS